MADNFKYVQAQSTTVAGAGSSIGDTTVTLTSFLQIDASTTLTMTNFGSIGFGTLEPGSGTNEEQISFTGITQNSNGTATLTGVKTVLFIAPYTQTSGLAKSHVGGAQFIISNTAGFYDEFVSKDNDETVNGIITYAQFPITPSSAPTTNYQVANKKYVDDTAVAGAPNASTTTKGIVQEATQAQTDAKTTSGSTGAELYVNPGTVRSTQLSDYVASDTGAADAYVIAPSPVITAYAAGQRFTFKAAHANTTASTLNVNALGTKTIKKLGNSTDLVANDIILNQIVEVEYDGTVMQMMSPSGKNFVDIATNQTIAGVKTFSSSPIAPTPSGTTDVVIKSYVDGNPITSTIGVSNRGLQATSGSEVIAHGLGRTPKKIRIHGKAVNSTSQISTSSGTWLTGGLYACDYGSTIITNVQPATSGTTTSAVIYMAVVNSDASINGQSATVSVDATNITLNWSKIGSSFSNSNLYYSWEAE